LKDYHSYIFDTKRRKFLGEFEEMYKEESKEGFDSWHQEDNRRLSLKICNAIMLDYNFSTIIDIGCGKGAYTQFLKKKNNCVVGVDISPTALAAAVARFP
jgi:methylase of polypeptide subunit release factors